MPKFKFQTEARFRSILVTFMEDEVAIGWITLEKDDADLIPIIEYAINKFNDKYTEKPPQTTTTGDPIQSELIGGPNTQRTTERL